MRWRDHLLPVLFLTVDFGRRQMTGPNSTEVVLGSSAVYGKG